LSILSAFSQADNSRIEQHGLQDAQCGQSRQIHLQCYSVCLLVGLLTLIVIHLLLQIGIRNMKLLLFP
jgi:hypothetical protein